MDTYFQDKVAVITGAGGTICSQIAKTLASMGVIIVLVGRTRQKLEAVASQIEAAGGKCLVYPCDVTDQAAVEAPIEEITLSEEMAEEAEVL